MLADGSLERLFRDSGRLDLAHAAEEARSNPDVDLGLYQLVERLPNGTDPKPKLAVYPRRLILGPYSAGGQHRTHISITNHGDLTLQGKIRIADEAPWIRLDERADCRQIALRIDTEQSIPIWIDTRGLASGQVLGTKLVIVSGGGLAEVPVALEITALAFPTVPFRSAASPRKLAELMRLHPREAAAALEKGEVSAWFASNGWAYPVPGTPARGMAGVQQFFECLGLARPPQLEVTPSLVRILSEQNRSTPGEVVLRTPSKKWVYAQVECPLPWVRIPSPCVSGPQQVAVPFVIDPQQLPEGTTQGEIHLIANGGTRLRVRIQAEVRKPPPTLPVSGWSQALVVGALTFLFYRLLAVVPADLIGRLYNPGIVDAGTLGAWQTIPRTEDGFLFRFVATTWWLGGLLGLFLVWKRQGDWLDLLGGLVAGTFAGMALFATLGCLVLLGDELPRGLLVLLAGKKTALPVAVATGLWLFLICGGWVLLGALIGAISLLLGHSGKIFLESLASPLRYVCRVLGIQGGVNLLQLR